MRAITKIVWTWSSYCIN